MDYSQIKIVQLEPMRVVYFHGFGESPEALALEKLTCWAQANGMRGRVFGFNNPGPGEGKSEYGYDVWMCVGEDEQMQNVETLRFAGGLYAVLRCPVVHPWQDIPGGWQILNSWLAQSGRTLGKHQWLEEHLDLPEPAAGVMFILDLYMPIE